MLLLCNIVFAETSGELLLILPPVTSNEVVLVWYDLYICELVANTIKIEANMILIAERASSNAVLVFLYFILIRYFFSLEQEVFELKNKVNKLEEENKRLSQLIHKHKVTLPSTWSDASVITTTMRATSSSRNTNTQTCSASSTSIPETAVASRARTLVHGSSDIAPISSNSSVTNRLSVTSILSSASNQLTTTSSRHIHGEKATQSMNKNAVALTQSSAIPRSIGLVPSSLSVETSSTPMSISETPNVHRSHNVAGAAPSSGLSQTSRSSHVITSANVVTKENLASRAPAASTVVQHMIAPQAQTTMVSSTLNAPTISQFPQQTTPASLFNRGFTQVQQLRSNSVQDNISQLPYSIDALTGNLSAQNRPQNSGTGQLLGFSAESLIGRQQPSNDVVMINNPVNQPVIQNTFTLTHPSTLTNANTSSSVPAQSFSNFSALSLVGSNDAFTGSATSSTQTLTRSTTTVPESANIPQTSNQMFTDFSTESLIGPSEFTSDFAIDNLISRSDSNVHMATVNPNLIQSFGRGNDPMISSVSGDHGNHSSHNYDSPGRSIGRRLSPHHYPAYWIF